MKTINSTTKLGHLKSINKQKLAMSRTYMINRYIIVYSIYVKSIFVHIMLYLSRVSIIYLRNNIYFQLDELKKALDNMNKNYNQLKVGAEGLLHENEDLKDK